MALESALLAAINRCSDIEVDYAPQISTNIELTRMSPWRFLLFVVFTSAASGGTPWVKLGSPTSSSLSKVSFIDSVTGWVAGDSGTIFMTNDGGLSWERQDTKIHDNIIDLFVLDQLHAWAVAHHYFQDTTWYGTVLLRTKDGGTTWTQVNFPEEYFFAVSFLDSVHGWMGGVLGKLWSTSDGGSSWSPTLVDSSMFMGYPVLHVDFYSPHYGFALGGHIDRAGVVWRTTDGGTHWAATCADNVSEPLHDLWYIDSLNVLAVGGDFDYGSGMVRSKDGGRSWQYTYLGIWGEARAIWFRTPGEAFVPLGFAGTYMVTTDTGRTWHDFYTPDSSAAYDLMFTDSLHGYMVGVNGTIFKYDPKITSVILPGPDLPAAPTLLQNFPNPFNPSTTISFILPQSAFVTIRVFDMLGREVATLFKGRESPGMHQVEFNGDAYPSGVYYYELTTASPQDRTTQVCKMLLVK